MPSSYVGDPTATQAPSDPPDPAVFPTVALPVDGDPPNASTFEQGYKVLADFIAWLMTPFAKASEWAVGIMTFRTAALHTRFLVDHLAFPSGRIIDWREWWPSTQLRTAAATGLFDEDGNLPGWKYSITAPGGVSIWAKPPDSTIVGRHRYIAFDIVGAGDIAILWRDAPCQLQPGNHVVVEFDLELEDPSAPNSDYVIQLGTDDPSGDPPADPSTDISFIRLYLPAGGGNWMYQSARESNSGSILDTGIAADGSFHRFRIEWHGENVAEDATRAVRIFMDGVLVGTLSSSAELPSLKPATALFYRTASGSASVGTARMFLGPVHFSANLWDSDVV